jgi:hypothetical protein
MRMRISDLPALMIALPLITGCGAGCSNDGKTAATTGTRDPSVQTGESAKLEKSIQDQEARIKELRKQNEDLRRQLNATAASGTSAPATP